MPALPRSARSPLWALSLPGAALAAGAARWLIQGSGNLYTDADKRFYVPDPDLGWRVVSDGPPWLGLELLGAMAGFAAALAVAAWVVRRRERARDEVSRPLRTTLWVAGAAPLAVPLWFVAGGLPPDGARETLPRGLVEAPTEGIDARLDGYPAGTYAVHDGPGSAITAALVAGGEAFEARFASGLEGTWRGDPGDLTQPMTATIRADAAAVDTGIEMRSKHAREDYLRADEHPHVTFELSELLAARQDGPGEVAFSARGVAGLIGDEHDVEVRGVLRAVDAAGRERLGTGAAPTLVVTASFTLSIAETALAPDAGDFDDDELPIQATLVLVHQGAAGRE